MKISEKYEREAAMEFLAARLNNERGNIDLLRKVKNEGEEYPCERCGYIYCICA